MAALMQILMVEAYVLAKQSDILVLSRGVDITILLSMPVGVLWIWPVFIILSNSVSIRRTIAVQASSSEKMTNEILGQILSAVEKSASSVEEIFTAYINKLHRHGNLQSACRLMQSLRDRNIFLSHHAYNHLMKVAGGDNNFDLLAQSFKDLLRSCESISQTSYVTLAKVFKDNEDVDFMLRFVREVSELTFPRNVTVLNRIIFAFSECGQIHEALLVFDQMKNGRCKPDLITYNTILQVLGHSGSVDDMLREFAAMREVNLIPDIVSYNTVINNLRKFGRLELCLKFFKEMCERGFQPDLRTYTALIEIFGRSGNIPEAVELFGEMKRKHMRPSIYIYRSLISNLKRMGKLELAMNFSKEMNACLSALIGPKNFKQKKR